MRPPMDPNIIIIEAVFALIAILFCLLIYFKTKESYELTKHNGIRYFRDAFLFFGLSYVLRFVFSIFFLSRIILDTQIPREVIMPIFILLLGYFSTISLMYLIFSAAWKKLNNKNTILILGHIFALLISILAFLTRSPFILLDVQIILIIIAIIFILIANKEKKKITSTKILYLLVASLWIINLLTASRSILPKIVDLIFQIITIGVFAIIYYKILKWTG